MTEINGARLEISQRLGGAIDWNGLVDDKGAGQWIFVFIHIGLAIFVNERIGRGYIGSHPAQCQQVTDAKRLYGLDRVGFMQKGIIAGQAQG